MTAVALSLDGSVMRTTEVKLPEDGIGGLVSLNFWVNQTTKLSPYPQSVMNLTSNLPYPSANVQIFIHHHLPNLLVLYKILI